jgi:hypothetical protein
MPNINRWLSAPPFIGDFTGTVDRAMDTGMMIADKPTTITVYRSGVALDAQTIRIDPILPSGNTGENVTVQSDADAIVLGYRNHPTITDTDLQRNDVFVVDGVQYEVVGLESGYDDRLIALIRARG